jgi:hypothetical protein
MLNVLGLIKFTIQYNTITNSYFWSYVFHNNNNFFVEDQGLGGGSKKANLKNVSFYENDSSMYIHYN